MKGVSIAASGDESKYIIKDINGIITGRINTVYMDKENKSMIIKLKCYKSGHEADSIIEESLKLYMDKFIKSVGIHKVNVLCDEDVSLTPFNSLGFQLEGYISDNIIVNNKHKGSLMLGITESDYYGNFYKKELVLKGEKVYLKVLTADDAEDLLNYYKRNREFLSQYEPKREESFYTIDVQKQSLIQSYKEYLRDEGVHFGIFRDGNMIGRIRISNIVQGVFRNAFIGYSIDQQCQGNGYMKEAVKLVLSYAYEELELHRIEATTLVDNIRSQGVLRGCGFTELGVSKDYLFLNGKWRDHIIFYCNRK